MLTTLVPEKHVAQSLGNINVGQSVRENAVGEDRNKSLTYKIQEILNEVSCREKIESNNPARTTGDADRISKGSVVSSSD